MEEREGLVFVGRLSRWLRCRGRSLGAWARSLWRGKGGFEEDGGEEGALGWTVERSAKCGWMQGGSIRDGTPP